MFNSDFLEGAAPLAPLFPTAMLPGGKTHTVQKKSDCHRMYQEQPDKTPTQRKTSTN